MVEHTAYSPKFGSNSSNQHPIQAIRAGRERQLATPLGTVWVSCYLEPSST